MDISRILRPLPNAAGRLAVIVVLCGAGGSEALAGEWTQPLCPDGPGGIPDLSCQDRFPSNGKHLLLNVLLPNGTNLPGPVEIDLYGPTTVFHNPLNNTFVQDGKDTINTEITNFDLRGSVFGFRAEIVAGFGNTFFITDPTAVFLDNTRGQVQDTGGAQNGEIDFPANSVFDVFFDLWIDFGNGAGGAPDGITQVGEVFSNDIRQADGSVNPLSFALRMVQDTLVDIPPPGGTVYLGDTGVWAFEHAPGLEPNPPTHRYTELGTFQATVDPLPFLYPILSNRECNTLYAGGNTCRAFGQLTGPARHTVAPEIDAAAGTGALSLLAGALALVGERRRRKTA